MWSRWKWVTSRTIQVLHAVLAQEVPGVDPAGARVLHRRMVVPFQAVVAAVHQHGKARPVSLHLPDQDGVAVAHVDKVQYQHVQPPCSMVAIYHITKAPPQAIKTADDLLPNFGPEILTS